MNWFFALAGATAALTFYVHTFIGGERVAKPLLVDQELPRASKWLNYYTWHMATVLLAAMSASFFWAAFRPDAWDIALLDTILATIYSPLSFWVARRGGIDPLRFPSTSLFAVTALLGAAGLWEAFR